MSFRRVTVLAVVLSCLHLENVGNDAVNGDITYQTCEEELLCDAGVHEPQGWETSQDTGQPAKTNPAIPAELSLSPLFCSRCFESSLAFRITVLRRKSDFSLDIKCASLTE